MIERAATAVLAIALTATASHTSNAVDPETVPDVSLAEQFISAFYSFDSEPLDKLLSKAGDSREDLLFYQGWALGGNYVVMERMPCRSVDADTVSCSITVQDDLVLALGIDFDVTDTFRISFENGAISAVATSSNDPQRYHDASDWVWENRREWVEAPCKGSDNAKPDPGQCVRNMLRGYRDYARLNGLQPRSAG